MRLSVYRRYLQTLFIDSLAYSRMVIEILRKETDLRVNEGGVPIQKVFFLVMARTKKGIDEKISELKHLDVPFIIICGEKSDNPFILYREKKGKFDAINYGSNYLPENAEFICINDVDTKIFNFNNALEPFKDPRVALVYCRVKVGDGPQTHFYPILDGIRSKINVVSSGELMIIRKSVFEKVLPIPPCKAEDTLITFKILEMGHTVFFGKDCWVETERTSNLTQEAMYKKRTVTGIYQALLYSKPPILTRVFYLLLPFFSPILLVQGRRGFCWIKGIVTGYANYLAGDRRGNF